MKTLFWFEPMSYFDACQQMEECVNQIKTGHAQEQAWYLEHEPVYTCGQRSTVCQEQSLDFPLIKTQRGGDITFHGPGQRVVYVMIDLRRRHLDIHRYIHLLEQWFIQTLQCLSIESWTDKGGRGLWTEKGKIVSIGVKVTSGITWHGVSCNVLNDLTPFQAIAPCGVRGQNMASVSCFVPHIQIKDVDQALVRTCPF